MARLDSLYMASQLHDKIVCRYGTPLVVRIDRGSKHKGRFSQYCKLSDIQQKYVATQNPRANG